MNTSDVSIGGGGVFYAFLHHLGPSLSELIGRFPSKSNEMLLRGSSKRCEELPEKVEHYLVNVFKFSPFLLRISPVDRKVVIIP